MLYCNASVYTYVMTTYPGIRQYLISPGKGTDSTLFLKHRKPQII